MSDWIYKQRTAHNYIFWPSIFMIRGSKLSENKPYSWKRSPIFNFVTRFGQLFEMGPRSKTMHEVLGSIPGWARCIFEVLRDLEVLLQVLLEVLEVEVISYSSIYTSPLWQLQQKVLLYWLVVMKVLEIAKVDASHSTFNAIEGNQMNEMAIERQISIIVNVHPPSASMIVLRATCVCIVIAFK